MTREPEGNPLAELFDDKEKASLFFKNVTVELKAMWREVIQHDPQTAAGIFSEQMQLIHAAVQDHFHQNTFGAIASIVDVSATQDALAASTFQAACHNAAKGVFVSPASVRKLEDILGSYRENRAQAKSFATDMLAKLCEDFSSKGTGRGA